MSSASTRILPPMTYRFRSDVKHGSLVSASGHTKPPGSFLIDLQSITLIIKIQINTKFGVAFDYNTRNLLSQKVYLSDMLNLWKFL